MDIKLRSAQMLLDHVDQSGREKFQRRAIVRYLDVTAERVKEPECRVCSVIEALLCAIGKHVRDQTVANVISECAKNVTRFEPATGCQGQAFEADHRVAPAIGEPMITGDNGAHLISSGMRARGFFETASGRDDKLIGRKS